MIPFSSPGEGIYGGGIRAFYGLRLPFGGIGPVNYGQKGGIFVHGFPERRFTLNLRLSELSPLRFLNNNGQ
jgi:hypothetical protein